MRRSEREITERAGIDAVLRRATVLHLAMVEDGQPHLVPMNFGYDGTSLILHSAVAGRKIDILRRNPKVSFSAVCDDAILPAGKACGWSARYRSVIGVGLVRFVEDPAEKRRALDCFMSKFSPGPFDYPEATLSRTLVLQVECLEMTGKQAGF